MQINGHSAARSRETFAKAQGAHPGKQVRPAQLRYEFVLDNNRNTYSIKLTNRNAANSRAAERALLQTDVFFAQQLGFFLAAQDARRPGSGQLLTYPSPAALALAYGVTVGTQPSAGIYPAPIDLEAFYSGLASLTIDKTTEFDGMDLRRSRYVPETQASGSIDKDAVTPEAGLIDLQPGFVLNGTKNAELLITLPSFNGVTPTWAASAPNQEVIGVIVLNGYEVAGASGLSR